MNYHHIFHSGNFADVFKHFILCLCLEKLQEKENPFFVIDTHSGVGKYDLSSELANKTGEYKDGILKLLQAKNIDPLFNSYLKIVERFNKNTPPTPLIRGEKEGFFLGEKKEGFSLGGGMIEDSEPLPSNKRGRGCVSSDIRTYPGSPQIIKQFLRENDKGIFAELHPQDFLLLKRNFAGNRKIKTINQDGYLLLKSHLPPAIKRGLILIDPPFERENGREDDFVQIIKYLREAYKRFATGIYLIWYPIVDENSIRQFHQEIMNLGIKKTLIAEIIIDQNIKEGFKGCGMVVVNFPYQLDEKLVKTLPLMLNYLGARRGKFKLELL